MNFEDVNVCGSTVSGSDIESEVLGFDDLRSLAEFDLFPRATEEEFANFLYDLRSNGQIDPIVSDAMGVILAGHMIYRAIKSLRASDPEGWGDRPVKIEVLGDLSPAQKLAVVYTTNQPHRFITRKQWKELAKRYLIEDDKLDIHMSNTVIALHCNMRNRDIQRLRKKMISENLISMPTHVVGKDGRTQDVTSTPSNDETTETENSSSQAETEGENDNGLDSSNQSEENAPADDNASSEDDPDADDDIVIADEVSVEDILNELHDLLATVDNDVSAKEEVLANFRRAVEMASDDLVSTVARQVSGTENSYSANRRNESMEDAA